MRKLAYDAGWTITKGPGIHISEALISMTLLTEPEEEIFNTVADQIREAIGYQLEVNF